MSEKLKAGTKILVGHMVLELLIETCKLLFWLITKEPLGLLNSNIIYEFLIQSARYINEQCS